MGGNMTEIKARENTESATENNPQFQVGDLAVYPAHGVGKIQAVESRVVNGEKQDFYIMKVRTDGVPAQTWNRRYREYMDKIKTGSLYDVAEVFRDLSLLKLTKDLSFGERKLFDTAQVLLVRELSTAKKTDEETIISELESLFVSDSLEN